MQSKVATQDVRDGRVFPWREVLTGEYSHGEKNGESVHT